MRAITFENVGTWVQYDALKGIIDQSGNWAVALDGDERHEWLIVALEMTINPAGAQATEHWLVLEDASDDGPDNELYVIPFREVGTVDF